MEARAASASERPASTLVYMDCVAAARCVSAKALRARSREVVSGTPLAAAFHVARTVCRRAERRVVTLASLSDTTIPANAIEYLNRLGQNLVRHSDVTFPVSFKMIESEEINAFTLPGGFVFINSGILKLSDNEAELASVLAHELGHAAARHATRQATREQVINLSSIPLSVFGGIAGLAVRQLAGITAPMAFFHFSRAFESEADLLGIQYLWKAGYDPNASVDMFERVESTERKSPGAVSKLFRTHPQTAERIEKTQKDIEQLLPQRSEYTVNTSEYEDVRARLYEITKPKASDKDPSVPTLSRHYSVDRD